MICVIQYLFIISTIVPGSETASTLLSTCSVFSSTDDSTVSTCDLSLLDEAVEAGSVVICTYRLHI